MYNQNVQALFDEDCRLIREFKAKLGEEDEEADEDQEVEDPIEQAARSHERAFDDEYSTDEEETETPGSLSEAEVSSCQPTEGGYLRLVNAHAYIS